MVHQLLSQVVPAQPDGKEGNVALPKVRRIKPQPDQQMPEMWWPSAAVATARGEFIKRTVIEYIRHGQRLTDTA